MRSGKCCAVSRTVHMRSTAKLFANALRIFLLLMIVTLVARSENGTRSRYLSRRLLCTHLLQIGLSPVVSPMVGYASSTLTAVQNARFIRPIMGLCTASAIAPTANWARAGVRTVSMTL